MNDQPCILVTPRSVTRDGHPALERLTRRGFHLRFCQPGTLPSEDELKRLLPGCVGYLAGVERIGATVLQAARDLKVIARNGTGTDNIDLPMAADLNIRVCRADGANARGVAELTLGLILSLTRAIPASDRAIKAGGWKRTTGIELEGRVLGLLGCGRIGKLVAQFALGMGMTVYAYDAMPDLQFSPSRSFQYKTEQEVFDSADIISLHCPPGRLGKPIIDGAAVGRMKKGVLLINTARCELVDRNALQLGLETNRIAGYGVDVYEQEPPGLDPLLADDRVVCTPHAGALTSESINRAVDVAVDHLLAALT